MINKTTMFNWIYPEYKVERLGAQIACAVYARLNTSDSFANAPEIGVGAFYFHMRYNRKDFDRQLKKIQYLDDFQLNYLHN